MTLRGFARPGSGSFFVKRNFVLASNVTTKKVPAEGPPWWIGDPLRRDPLGLQNGIVAVFRQLV